MWYGVNLASVAAVVVPRWLTEDDTVWGEVSSKRGLLVLNIVSRKYSLLFVGLVFLGYQLMVRSAAEEQVMPAYFEKLAG